MNLVGPTVRKLREAQGLTQDELAARCNLIGWAISRSTLAKMESQVRRINDMELLILARALKVSVSDLYPEQI